MQNVFSLLKISIRHKNVWTLDVKERVENADINNKTKDKKTTIWYDLFDMTKHTQHKGRWMYRENITLFHSKVDFFLYNISQQYLAVSVYYGRITAMVTRRRHMTTLIAAEIET